MLLLAMLAAASAPDITVVGARSPLHAMRAVSDRELSTMRGGFELPNGLNLQLGIDVQTRVDGVLAVHTIYASDGPNAGLRVFTDGLKSANPATPPAQSISTPQLTTAPVLVVDRSPSGTTVLPSSQLPATTVNVVTADPGQWLSGEGQTQLPVVANGDPVPASIGTVRLTSDAQGSVVTLQAPDLEVRQLVGQASGTVVLNSASDRTIDTVGSINVNLQGLSPQLLNAAFAADRLAAAIARGGQ